MNENGAWIRASDYTVTSLAIQVLSSNTDIKPPDPPLRTSIRYVRSLNRLNLPETNLESGEARVYAVSGQLLQRIPIAKGQDTVTIRSFHDGTVGIVRVIRGNETYEGKFIY